MNEEKNMSEEKNINNIDNFENSESLGINTLDEETIESTCLNNLVICFTGFEAEELSLYEEQIVLMGGTYSPHLTNDVTHLVSKNTVSDKYKFAAKLGIPIIQENWINECWNRRLERGFNGKRIAEQYLLPPFVDVQICVTGISGENREVIENFTRLYGGQYSADLTHQCTHLIVEKPNGRKYEYAKKWGLYLVNPRWFTDCISKRVRIDESDYLLENNDEEENNTDETYDMNDFPDDENFDFLMSEEIKKNMINNSSLDSYLERCIIYFGSGFSPEKLNLLKKCVLHGGGTRYSDFNSKVTHYIVKSKKSINKSDKEILNSIPNQCVVVSYKWLQKCFIDKKLCSIDEFKIDQPQQEMNSQIIYQNDNDEDDDDDNDENDIQNKGKLKIRNNSLLLNFDVNNIQYKNSKVNPNKVLTMEPSYPESQNNSINEELKSTIIQPISKLFEGLNFVSKGFSPNHEQIIEKEVLKHSGQYFHSEISIKNNYYQILPFINTLNIIVSQKAIIVTEHWLERCLIDDILHNPDENPIYIPCTLEMPIEEFNGIVIGNTGFNGIEKAHIGKLVVKLGAIYTDTLTRKHDFLICKPESINNSLKYRKALEWNIPILEVDWIYDCFRQERRLPYENYLINNKTKSKDEREVQEIQNNDVFSSLSNILSNNNNNNNEIHMREEPEEMQIDQEPSENKENNNENKDKEPVEMESKPKKEENPELLKGVVISISQRLSHKKNEIWELASKMGAECIIKFNDTCTHYIHSGVRAKESFKDFKLALSKKKFIVSPVWLEKCYELQKHVPENDYPHTYNPNKQLLLKSNENNQNGNTNNNNTNNNTNNDNNNNNNNNNSAMNDKNSKGKDLTRSHSSANLNSFYENYVIASKSNENNNNSNENNNNNENNSNENTNNDNDNNKIESLSKNDDKMSIDNSDENNNEKAEGYVSAMDNIIKMTSMRRRPRSIRRDTSNDKTKIDNETRTSNLDLETSKRKFVEENDEGLVKIDDPEARMEKLKLLDKVNQNKKRIKTLSPDGSNIQTTDTNSSNSNSNSNSSSNTDINNIPDKNEKNIEIYNNSNESNENNENDSHTTMGDSIDKPEMIKDTKEEEKENKNELNNEKPIENEKEKEEKENDKIKIKKEVTPRKNKNNNNNNTNDNNNNNNNNNNPIVYDDSFVINKTNLRSRPNTLGGKVSEKDHWDESCTHLIIKEPNRGEKYLAAIASGIWVLKPEYMEESINQGRFVNEEDYEWGRSSSDSNIAKAAPRWRLKLENFTRPIEEKFQGSFEGWDILLMVDSKKREGFTRLLKAGKGKVTILKNSLRNIKNKEYTHFFIDGTTRNRLKDLSSLSYLIERNIQCYDAQYIAEYLISPNPQSSRFEIKI
ncbi:BRCT domain-containing protein [Anaeromyces robustus]|uniref:BRCT domain-containing protein n=1 Tax=Anaeromyces robustus TaxID=1754192 RepID=A0A1Y1XPB0_9FUNG|nr:BRCT domain-containing protein [Anaeromyces robustus]|eukprot:ORX87579.1 BRCT domain-containing protein [Anaeromyces robustus]